MVDVRVTLEFRINNAYDQDDLDLSGYSPFELVEWLILEEGILGLAEGNGRLKSVEEVGE
jgi:hypothetical protein